MDENRNKNFITNINFKKWINNNDMCKSVLKEKRSQKAA